MLVGLNYATRGYVVEKALEEIDDEYSTTAWWKEELPKSMC